MNEGWIGYIIILSFIVLETIAGTVIACAYIIATKKSEPWKELAAAANKFLEIWEKKNG